MDIKKMAGIGVILMAVSASLLGCGGNKAAWTGQAKEMLHEKYDEDFDIFTIGRSFGTAGNATYTVTCAPQTDENCLFEAEIEKGGHYMQDGYISKIVSMNMEQVLSEELDGIIDDYYLHLAPGGKFVDSADKNLTLQQYLQWNPKTRFAVYLAVSDTSIGGNEAEIREAVQRGLNRLDPISGSLRISMLPEEKVREALDYMSERAVTDSGFIKILEEGIQYRMAIEQGIIQ